MKIDVRKKILNLAVASAVGVAGLASLPAHAMSVASNGLGQVLIYPYYTVKNGFDTVFTVTNTGATTVVAKVRWREALNSRETRDFNIVLSPFDVWTAAVTSDASGNGAVVRTYDNTCTSPALPTSTTAAGSREVAFTSIAYDGTDASFPNDKASTALSRVREGYFEVISMGQFISEASAVPTAAKHGATGVPANCTTVANSTAVHYNGPDLAANTADDLIAAPANVLKGSVSFINVASGQAVDAPVTAIAGFSDGQQIWDLPGNVNPDLADGDAAEAANYIDDDVAYADAGTQTSAESITIALMADTVINEYAADGVGSMTDWVLTFPTKHHYTDVAAVIAPFTDRFPDNGTACETVGFTLYNREEGTVTPSGNQFSPAPTGSSVQLCYEANVLTFNGSSVFGDGTNRLNVSTSGVGSAGWLALTMTGAGAGVGAGADAVTVGAAGLPVIGFAALIRNNAADAGNNRNYGSTVEHAYVRN